MLIPIRSSIKVIFSKKKNVFVAKGPFGGLRFFVFKQISFIQKKKSIKINDSELNIRSLSYVFNNIFSDLVFGFERKLELKGIGFQVYFNKEKTHLIFKLGYSHLIQLQIPKNIWVRIFNKKFVLIRSFSRLHVSRFVSQIRNLKKVNAYKEKGIFFEGEVKVFKIGKSAA